jgi:hypothetical protein
MRASDYSSIALYVGVLLVTGIFLAIFTIIAAYTAWGMILPVSDSNMEAIFRSKFGMHVMLLPNKLATATIYVYLAWMTILLWQLLPLEWGIVYTVLALLLFFNLHFVFSGLSRRVIMHSKAMQNEAIFSNSQLLTMHQKDYDKAFLEMVQSNQRPTMILSLFSPSVSANDVRQHYHSDNVTAEEHESQTSDVLQQNSEHPLAQMMATPLKLELRKQTRANTKRYQWPSVVIALTTILEVCDFK